MKLTVDSHRVRRLLTPAILMSVTVLGATGCSSDDATKGASTSSTVDTSTDERAAAEALDAGLEAHASGDLVTATKQYEETLALDPANKFAYYNLALIDEAGSNYGLAEQKYRKAIEADAAYEPALFNLAILVTSSDPKEAISLYRRAVSADAKDASAWMNLGLLLRASGRRAEGNDAVATALELNPKLTDPA